MSKIVQLLDRASDKFTAAEILANHEYFEDAVTRMFHGLLFCARALLHSKSISLQDPDEVISAFNKEFVKPGTMDKDFGKLLKDTKTMAEKADFSLSFNVSEEKIKSMMGRAELFMERVEDTIGEEE